MSDELTYSNPRMTANFDNWPYGQKETKCEFSIQAVGNKGQRCAKRTYDPTRQRWNKPRLGTYSTVTRIMDGSDGRTYVVSWSEYGFFSIMRSCLKLSQESINETDPRFSAMREMLGVR